MEDPVEDAALQSQTRPEDDPLLSSAILRHKFNVQPREDEGRETLPAYSSAISLCNVFLHKKELEGAVHKAQDRSWHKVSVFLQGTALTLHAYKSGSMLSSWGKDAADRVVESKMGGFLKSYNLQHADVGVAADYYKKKYVIRVRAETDQFLLSCSRIETFVIWLQSLFAAIDLAPPLDDREIPKDISIPQPRRRSTRETCVRFAGDVNNEALIRDQIQLMQRHYPHLVPQSTASSPSSSSTTLSNPSPASSSPRPYVRRPRTAPTLSQSTVSSRSTRQQSLSSSSDASNPSINEEGKWQPRHHWSASYDMMYAKRCMATLTHRSPRKTDFVIAKGKRWLVDWKTGGMTRVEPPGYGEVVEKGVEAPVEQVEEGR
ncbi:hypothetical protein B0O99DRAFT_511119 [Bisporella sp. PMI_857]|nr:hypothetical protein B0O99DRAFT_511119 [Bisporella sp. PMI_857]